MRTQAKEVRALSHLTFESDFSLLIEPSRGRAELGLRELWKYRELLYFLVWRNLKVRYKQTFFGAAWALFQPLVSAIIFTLIFSILARIPSEGIPYPIFSLAALLPWTYFSRALERASRSVVESAHLITKVYFPRLIIPLSEVLSGLVDLAIGFIPLVALMVYYGINPTVGLVLLPFFVLLSSITAFGVSLWLSALDVYYRDVRYVVPFLIQIWMYATPIIYPLRMVPERFRWILGLNPMVGVVEGFRWALLGHAYNPDLSIVASVLVAVLLCAGGMIFFRRMGDTFADVV